MAGRPRRRRAKRRVGNAYDYTRARYERRADIHRAFRALGGCRLALDRLARRGEGRCGATGTALPG
jgi:hypothetical protein